MLQESRVVVVEGDTGCGKTTQLPQYVLEAAAETGTPCGIVVMQPRRISAIGVAERVAEERGERCGGAVGYAIRLETRASAATALLFCTIGVLSRRLESDPELQGVTHVFADEVHERSVESDFMLLALLDLHRRRPELCVVLMSATLDGDLLSRYFGGAPRLAISGRAFPVASSFLEDALEMTRHEVDASAPWASRRRRATSGGCGGGGASAVPPEAEDLSDQAVQERYGSYSQGVRLALTTLRLDVVNFDLAAQVVGHFARKPAPPGPNGEPLGAILVFLSGAKEIQSMRSALLRQNPELGREPACSWILALHSSLPAEEQRVAFRHPPRGVRKVLLATNIAETSITIDDVGVVVDTAHVKELRYDPARRLASLEDVFISRATARQRRGRAGRVAPGTCVHLVTKFCHDRLLPAHPQAEVHRVALEQLVMRIHATGTHLRSGGGAEAACARLVEPPDWRAARASVEELVGIGALQAGGDGEHLTPLGLWLAELPVNARVGKLVLLGAALGRDVLDAALTAAAALTVGSPFASPFERRYEATRAHRALAESLVAGGLCCSDVLGALAAYAAWDRLSDARERSSFCHKHFLRAGTLQEMAKARAQLCDILTQADLAPPPPRRRASTAHDIAQILVGLLCAAFFPQVVLAVPKESHESLMARTGAGGAPWCPLELLAHDGGGDGPCATFTPVQIHPSSVSGREKIFGSRFVLYHELVRTERLHLRGVTAVPPLALALFAGALSGRVGVGPLAEAAAGRGTWRYLELGFIRLAMPAPTFARVLEMRRRLDGLWRVALQRPPGGRPPWPGEVVNVLARLLIASAEGSGGG